MPSDASVYNLLGQGVTPLLNPLDIQAKRNALALGQLQLQQLQRQMSDEAATRAAMQQYYAGAAPAAPAAPAVDNSTPGGAVSVAPGMPALPDGSQLPGAAPYVPPAGAAAPAAPGAAAPAPAPVAPPPTPTMADLIRAKVPPAAAAGLVASFQKLEENAGNIRKAQAEADKANGELDTSVKEYGADAANAIIKSNYNPAVISFQLQHFSSLGKRYAQMAAGLVQQIQANPSQMPALFQSMADAGKGNREAAAAEMTAGARRDEVANQTRLGDQTIADKQKADLSALLGTAANQNDWNRILGNANPAAVAALNVPAAFSPAARDAVVRAGTTPDQQITAAETAKRDDNTNRNERARVALDARRVAIEAQNSQVNRAAADPWGTLGLNPHPIGGGGAGNLHGDAFLATLPPALGATVRAVAEGRQTNLPRGGKELDQLMGAVNQYDPTYSKQRGEMRTAFMTGKQGQNIGNLNTAVVHFDQLHEVLKALNNGSFQPGNHAYNWVAEKFGSATATNPDFVIHALAGEAANALKGNATDPEIAGILKTISKDQSNSQQQGNVLEGLRILGSKLNTYDEQYHQLSPDDPWTPVLPSARGVFNRYKIQPLSRISQAADPAPAPAPGRGGAPAAAKVDLSKVPTDQLLKALGQ